ncbi:hypothetical protein DASC09_028770 [Saccharomycopsis crataegensis]|uniref:Uncharacterized protein n=1 Tax=Saccharomycopsis crataegensis TaxID=43959 RepID=A0AAV5QLQ4_9ASCO|nr:hypothetical protein DASC09_028770 [Saccharomycopsis crataegensis]
MSFVTRVTKLQQEFPLVLEYMKTAFATLSLENPTFIADQFFEADSSNQAPYFLGVLIQAALRVKLDEKLFKRVMHKQPNGVLAWYAFAKKYKSIDYESQVQVLHNFGYALTKGNSELMERATTAFAYYFDVPKKLIPLAASAIMDDGTRQKFFDKTGYNDLEAGFENLSFDEVAGFFEEMSQKYSRIEEENSMELAQNVVHQRGSSGRKNWTCWNCGKKGHIARDCPNHKPGLSKFYERKPDARAFYSQTVFDAEENHSSEEAWLVETKPGPGTGISSVKPNYGRKKAFSTVGACKTDAAVRFTLDSGSTCHLANMKIKLANVRRDDTKVLGVNGLSTVKQQGDLLSQKLSVNGIKLMDGLPRNLLSIPKIVDSGFDVLLSKHNGSIVNRKNGNVVLNFPRVGPFWELSVKADSAEEMAFNVESYEGLKAIKEVHESNNHAKLRTMKELLKGRGVLEADIKYVLTSCETCMSKVTKPGGKPAVRKYNVGEMIQADVIGPINKAYALIVSDRASKFVAHRVLKSRAEVSAKTIECLGMFHNFLKQADSNKNIVMFRADNEFDTNAIKNWLDGSPSSGRNFIDFEPTAPHSSHQNGGAERLNGILQEKMFSILKASGVDISYWNFALSHAVFVHNYLPLNGGRSPYELLREQKKEFQVKAPFGCRVFIKDYHRQSKFDPIQEEAGVFLGYSKTTKIVFALLKDGRVVRSSAFRFMPLVYPLKNGQAALGGGGSGGGMFVGGGGGRVGGVSGASGGVHVPDRDMSVDSIAAFDENLENVTQDSSFSGGDESSVEEEDQAEPFDVDMSDATASKSDGQTTPEQVGAKQASPDPVFPDPMPRSESSGDVELTIQSHILGFVQMAQRLTRVSMC